MTIVIIRAVLIYVFVILAIRIMGKRQVGELKPHELVITILISSVATLSLEEKSIPLANTILPIMIFVSFEILESAISMKSLKFRDLVQGKPIFIIKNGILQQDVMKKLRFTMDDLIDALRQEGAFDIAEVENAVVETNGSLSVQLKADCSPVTPSQLKLTVDESEAPIAIVLDGEMVEEYYSNSKISKKEIELYLSKHKLNEKDIMMLSLDDKGHLYLIRKEKE